MAALLAVPAALLLTEANHTAAPARCGQPETIQFCRDPSWIDPTGALNRRLRTSP